MREKDADPAEVVYLLKKNGHSLRQISIKNGYRADTAKLVLRKAWPKMERIVSGYLGIKPWEIWPSRYDSNGRPNRPLGRPRHKSND